MADRLTQLQDAVNVQADNLCNSLGILQQSAVPTNFAEFSSFNRSISQAYARTLAEAGVVLPDTKVAAEQAPPQANGNLSGAGSSGTNKDAPTEEPTTSAAAAAAIPTASDNRGLFVKLITKTAKDIDVLIDSLPSKEAESEIQEAHIARLQAENLAEARELSKTIEEAEAMLAVIQEALDDIAQNMMRMKKLEAMDSK